MRFPELDGLGCVHTAVSAGGDSCVWALTYAISPCAWMPLLEAFGVAALTYEAGGSIFWGIALASAYGFTVPFLACLGGWRWVGVVGLWLPLLRDG